MARKSRVGTTVCYKVWGTQDEKGKLKGRLGQGERNMVRFGFEKDCRGSNVVVLKGDRMERANQSGEFASNWDQR